MMTTEEPADPKQLAATLKQLKKEIAKLNFLVDASKLLNSSLDLGRLLEVIVDLASRGTGSERGTLYILDPARNELWSKVAQGPEMVEIRLPVGQGIAGCVAATGEVIRIDDAYADDRFDRNVDRLSGFRTRNILTVPMKNKQEAIIGVLQVLNKEGGAFLDEDVSFLEVLQTHAAIAIENALLFKEALEKKRLDRELELAADIQRRLLPESPPELPGIKIAAFSEPCRHVGGDYYDFLGRKGNRVGICIADVSGKGIPASLLMATLRASLHAQVEGEASVLDIVVKVNRALHRSSRPNQFATCFYGELDPVTGVFNYVNAGHLPPVRRGRDGSISMLKGGGTLLGLSDATRYEQVAVTLDPGDVVFFYTDGVTDAESPDREDFGETRLMDLIRTTRDLSPDEALQAVINAVKAFEAGAPRTDDLTAIILARS